MRETGRPRVTFGSTGESSEVAAKAGRLFVIDERDESRVPFLRGILTRSIQDSGLPFSDAYRLAGEIRDGLGDHIEIRANELRVLVSERLRGLGLETEANRYMSPRDERESIHVRSRSGDLSPFSRGLLTQSLEICAITRDEMYSVAGEVEALLVPGPNLGVSSADVGQTTARTLRRRFGAEVAGRYVRWVDFNRSGEPLVLLIGGTTGCGKSTLSALLAHRLGIVRTQSTDILREVMRLLVPVKLMPSLHESSYGAYKVLPRWLGPGDVLVEPHMLDGYLMQADEVSIAVEGVYRRAIREQLSLILEGVHIHPSLQKRLEKRGEGVVVSVVLAALKKKRLKKQLTGRSQLIKARRAEPYLDYLDEIWQLQTFLLSEADRHGVPIVLNSSPEESVRQVVQHVADALVGRFSDDEKAVFQPH